LIDIKHVNLSRNTVMVLVFWKSSAKFM